MLQQLHHLQTYHLPGDTISFSDLEITFLVDENLENYREIHGWMYGIGFPKSRTQFADLV